CEEDRPSPACTRVGRRGGLRQAVRSGAVTRRLSRRTSQLGGLKPGPEYRPGTSDSPPANRLERPGGLFLFANATCVPRETTRTRYPSSTTATKLVVNEKQ